MRGASRGPCAPGRARLRLPRGRGQCAVGEAGASNRLPTSTTSPRGRWGGVTSCSDRGPAAQEPLFTSLWLSPARDSSVGPRVTVAAVGAAALENPPSASCGKLTARAPAILQELGGDAPAPASVTIQQRREFRALAGDHLPGAASADSWPSPASRASPRRRVLESRLPPAAWLFQGQFLYIETHTPDRSVLNHRHQNEGTRKGGEASRVLHAVSVTHDGDACTQKLNNYKHAPEFLL